MEYILYNGSIDETYSKVDIMGIAEGEIKKYGLSGKAADTVRNQYESLVKDLNS